MLDMMKKLEEMQMKLVVAKEYAEKDIDNFLKVLDEIDAKNINDAKDKEYMDNITRPLCRLELIDMVLLTKKIENNQKDLIKIGKYLEKIGKEITNIGKNAK